MGRATAAAIAVTLALTGATSGAARGQGAYQEQPQGAYQVAPQGGYQGQPQGYPGSTPPGAYQAPSMYQGQVQTGIYGQPPAYGGQPGGYPPAAGYPPVYQQGAAQGQYYPPQGGAPPSQYYPPPGGYLQGGAAIIAAGTHFQAALKNSIDSGSSQVGEEIQATLNSPLYSNGAPVVPAGSRLIGQITNVVSARRFQFGANGRVDIRFTSIETPDGRRFPLSASVDTSQLRLSGGSTGGRVGKGLMTVGAGAAAGALFGTALGPIVGATSDGRAGKATGMGAVFGTAIGAGAGAVGAAARKGSEVKIPAGTALPIQLDESLQVTTGGPPPVQQPYGGYPGGYAPPVTQPAGGYYPQQ